MKKLIFAALVGSSAMVAAAPVHHAPASAPPKPSLPAKLYDFNGVPLEISLDDFRKLPHPDAQESLVVCTGEKEPIYHTQDADTMVYDAAEKAANVVKCVWVYTGSDYGRGSITGLRLLSTGYAANEYSFSFVRDPKDGVMRLYEFTGQSNIGADAAVVAALTTKFGTPVTTTGQVQNAIGNNFEQSTSVWSNPLATLTVQDRFSKIDDMGIVMTDTRLAKIMQDIRKAKDAATPNAI